MNILAFTFLVIVFLVCFVMIEIYFFKKSRRAFKELKQAYKEYREAKNILLAGLDNSR